MTDKLLRYIPDIPEVSGMCYFISGDEKVMGRVRLPLPTDARFVEALLFDFAAGKWTERLTSVKKIEDAIESGCSFDRERTFKREANAVYARSQS